MSASEKLKALEQFRQDHPGAWLIEIGDALGPALPQIVAVVEAAEKEAPFEERGGNTGDLRRSLAALEEALS